MKMTLKRAQSMVRDADDLEARIELDLALAEIGTMETLGGLIAVNAAILVVLACLLGT